MGCRLHKLCWLDIPTIGPAQHGKKSILLFQVNCPIRTEFVSQIPLGDSRKPAADQIPLNHVRQTPLWRGI